VRVQEPDRGNVGWWQTQTIESQTIRNKHVVKFTVAKQDFAQRAVINAAIKPDR